MQKTTYQITVNGQDITATIADRLIRMVINDNAGIDSDSIDIELDDRKPHINEPDIDADLKIWINKDDQLHYMGLYIIDETATNDKAGTLSIHGKAADMVGSLKAPRDHSYHDQTLDQFITTIAERHSYNPAVSDELKAQQLPHIDQRGESDLSLLTRIVKPLGAIAKANDRKLIVLGKDQAKTVSGKPLPEITLDGAGQGVYINSTSTARSKYKRVTAYYKTTEMATKEAVKVGAEKGANKRLKDVYKTQQLATQAAQAELEKLSRETGEITATIEGDPNYKAEHKLNLINHRKAGNYTIQTATHTISGGQIHTTSFKATTGEIKT